jgi:DNA-binding NarL/FixJ family response regulator
VGPEVQEGGPEARARLVIADDHAGTRVLLRTLLSLHPEIEVVGEAEDGEEAARLAVSGEADIALLDIEMPRMDGLTAAELIRSVRPRALSLTNSTAFSPTDAMPLTRPAKTLMAAESTLSAITILLIAHTP